MPKTGYTRKMSYNDRLFVAAAEICPPGLNQFVCEGEGTVDIKKWREAVNIASEANPGSRIILKGHLGFTKWVDSGINPSVVEIDGSGWDGLGPEGAPFLDNQLDLWNGPTSEVMIIRGNPLRILFRTHHAAMDGMGLLTWMEDIFRVLRGEAPIGSASPLTDTELVRSVQKEFRKPFPKDNIVPTGKPVGDQRGVVWKRIIIPGSYKNILGQVVVLSAREAWKYQEGPVRFAIPVDIRFRQKGLRTTANFAIAIYVEVKKDSTPESVAADIQKQVIEKRDCMIDRSDMYLRYLPLKFLVNRGNARIKKFYKTGKFSSSGLISNMGRPPVEVYSGGGFNTRLIWGIPPSLETCPYLIGLATRPGEVTLSLAVPRALNHDNRMDKALQNIIDGLVPAEKKG